ncbi:MAG: S41 family peptidase [Armatimonadota bacterium]
MHKIKSLKYLIVAALAIGAFATGSELRVLEAPPTPSVTDSVQANALLKLTPECAPITSVAGNGNEVDRELLGSVVRLLKSYYVEQITPESETKLARGAVRGMLESLADTDSHFLDPGERKLMDEASNGTFRGVGAILALRTEGSASKIVVVAPMPGSPAESAHLLPGDVVTHVNGKWVISYNPFDEPELERLRKAARNKEIPIASFQKAFEAAGEKLKNGMDIPDALEVLTAKTEGEAALTVERAGKPIEISVTCAVTRVVPVTAKPAARGITYIKISQFNARAAKDFDAALAKALADRTKAIVIDLRNNPGGLMDSAVSVSGRVAGGGNLAVVQEKGRSKTFKLPSSRAVKVPVAVLVNGGTASVAELVAGTLHERVNAALVGEKTFGDGLVQTPLILKDGSAALLTTGRMLTPGGRNFNGKGLQPDRAVASADAQLDEAIKLLKARL